MPLFGSKKDYHSDSDVNSSSSSDTENDNGSYFSDSDLDPAPLVRSQKFGPFKGYDIGWNDYLAQNKVFTKKYNDVFDDEPCINTELRIKLCQEIRSLPSAEHLSNKYKLNEEIRSFDKAYLLPVNRSHYWRSVKNFFGF